MAPIVSTPIIIALKGSQNISSEGCIIEIDHDADLVKVKTVAKTKLGLSVSLAQILLQEEDGTELDDMQKLRDQKVVYVDLKDSIKEVFRVPGRLPMIGNLYNMMPDTSDSFHRYLQTYGGVINVNFLGTNMVATNDPDVVEVFVKENEFFTKKADTLLGELKDFSGDGLFTSDTDTDEWKLAHKLLMPAFSPRAVKAYQPEMGQVVLETIKVLEQYDPAEKVEILPWCTNLSFEIIGRVGFGYSFDLMHLHKPAHPFIEAMAHNLEHSFYRFMTPKFIRKLPLKSNYDWENGNNLMHSIVDDIIKERRASKDASKESNDLLGYMLNARDENNLALSDENIRFQVVTFLIAGHDTSANTIAWALYELSQNPDVEAKVIQEIVNLGIKPNTLPTTKQISHLKYLDKVIRETLRLHPALREFAKYCKKDCVVPGGYKIKAGTTMLASVYSMHINPKVFPNPLKFDPERFSPEEEQKRSRFSWLPFSTGPRGCIGMALALQELKTALCMLLIRFKFYYDGPPVFYDYKQPTTKPSNFYVNILPRDNSPKPQADIAEKFLPKVTEETTNVSVHVSDPNGASLEKLPKITFLYGSQTGISQDYAHQLSSQARKFGFKDVVYRPMNLWDAIHSKDSNRPQESTSNELVVICTATYNGFPPDSAELFDRWITLQTKENKTDLLHGITYAVFGVGNRNWRTYQAFPIKVDSSLRLLGAERCFPLGSGDADGDCDAEFSEWSAHFWAALLNRYGIVASVDKSVVPFATLPENEQQVGIHIIPSSDVTKLSMAKGNTNGQSNAFVLVNKELQGSASDRSTRHIEIDVSRLEPIGEGHIYEPGDHIEIYPQNSIEEIEQLALGFGLDLECAFEIDPDTVEGFSPRTLARSIQGPCTVRNAFQFYADILSPPSRMMLSYFAAQLRQVAPETADMFERLIMPDENNEDHYPEFIKTHRTLLDLQKAFPQVKNISTGQFLAAVNVMQPRRYSIASSPLAYPSSVHLSVAVVDDFINGKHYPGLASTHLKRSEAGFGLRVNLISSKDTFDMPKDLKKPLVMIASGTGIAPFRGFLQHRDMEKKSGKEVAPSLLLFGCRHPEKDHLYREEIQQFIDSKVLVNSYNAFSRTATSDSRKYVQHELSIHATEVWEMLSHGALYVCGNTAMTKDVRTTFQAIIKKLGIAESDEDAEAYIQSLEHQKAYVVDVWGSN
ncbi:cytochrome P450 [Blakeslea trispora]|nr:cytochrome P450 [Blakeslea trispora]